MARGYWAYIVPATGRPGRPDQGLPGGGEYPDQGLPGGGYYPDQGLPGGGGGGSPSHPIYIPGAGPSHPIVIPGAPPGSPGSPQHPIWIGDGSSRPDHGLPVPPGTIEFPDPPPELAGSVIVAVYTPGQGWTSKSYPLTPDHGLPPGANYPDQGLPEGQPGAPDQGLPPQPPVAQPKRR